MQIKIIKNLKAWLLCVICIFGGAFMVWGYAIVFGNDKTYQVLTQNKLEKKEKNNLNLNSIFSGSRP